VKRRGVLCLFANRRFYATTLSRGARQSSRSPEVDIFLNSPAGRSSNNGNILSCNRQVKRRRREGDYRASMDEIPSFLPRQPEATIHCNAASVRPGSCALHFLFIVFEIELWNFLADSTLASKNKTEGTSSILFQASVIDHATKAQGSMLMQ
jgi:hypothetical protein